MAACGENYMPKKIDPLNKKNYSAVSVSLTVADIPAASKFYKQAFGFAGRGNFMKGPDGKPMHAELTLRGTSLMLGPEMPPRYRSAKTLGGSPTTLYILVDNVDKVVAKAVKLGGVAQGPVTDMFWGDRVGYVVDADGYTWMIATHIAEPTPAEMKKAIAKMGAQSAASGQ